MLAHLVLQVYAIPQKPQAFAILSKMASGHVFATVGTTKFDLFISTLSCQKVLHVSEQHTLQFLIKTHTHCTTQELHCVRNGTFPTLHELALCL